MCCLWTDSKGSDPVAAREEGSYGGAIRVVQSPTFNQIPDQASKEEDSSGQAGSAGNLGDKESMEGDMDDDAKEGGGEMMMRPPPGRRPKKRKKPLFGGIHKFFNKVRKNIFG